MDQDVIVSGAGPVGLMLACELALQGVSVVVLERLTEQDLTIKAGAMTLPACEALNRRGFSGELAELQRQTFKRFGHWPPREPEAGAKPKPPMLAHFGGLFKIDVSRLDPEDELLQLNPAAITPMVSQQELERVLAVRAEKLGVETRRGVELVGFTQDEDGVTVELADGQRLRGGYLVGCDGGRSTVRKLAGFDFPGTDPTITGYQAIVDLDAPEKLTKGWTRTPNGTLVSGPVPGRVLTVEYDGPPADRAAPVTLEDVQTSLRRVSGTDVTIEKVHTATRFSDNARQVTTYRQGRVLLAGDAAHVHSPFGGQGLNLGIGDAVNLGWKLAATVQGWAPDGLLDTYTAERHPIGAEVLETTRAQVASLRPDPLSGALRKIISDLMDTDEGNDYFARLMLGFGQRYDLGAGDRIAGARTPDYELADGSWMGDRFASGKAALFDFSGAAGVAAAVAGHEARITLVSLPAKGKIELTALLVRPDGYVAWASRVPGETAGLAEAIGRWFGGAR